MKADLSILVLSYNTKETTKQCLEAVLKNISNSKISTQFIIVDNASTDGSVQMIREFSKNIHSKNIEVKTLFSKKNLGFSGGNNIAIEEAKGKYILFLNSDVILENVDFDSLLNYLDSQPNVGVLTVKVQLPNGTIDPASHRGFPTIWNSLSYFLKLEKIFRNVPFMNKLFGGYHLTYMNMNKTHEIDSPTGAFYLVKKKVLDKVGGFDEENFFMYGEDLDLSYRIKQTGYQIVYHPFFLVTHLKYRSGLGKKDQVIQHKTRDYFYDSMKAFYRKHYEKKHGKLVNKMVYLFIDLKKKIS